MAQCEPAVAVVLEHEGSAYVNDPNDPGGPTRYGITLKWAQEHRLDVNGDGVVDVEDIKALTPEIATIRYRVEIWEPLGLGRLVDQLVATKLLDLAVHAGPSAAITCLQRAAGHGGARLAADGQLGPVTVAAVNAQPGPLLLLRFALQQASLYGACIQRNPALEEYRWNWLQRAAWGAELALQHPGGIA
jgi:type VI secretion system secreted protein VgrG